MLQKNSILKFIRSNIVEEDGILLTGSAIIDSAIDFYLGSSILLKAEPYTGTTSLCLSFAEEYSKKGLVLYIDCNDSFLPSRSLNLKEENFIHLRPYDSDQILESVLALRNFLASSLIILDNSFLLINSLKISNLAVQIRKILPDSTIVVSDRFNTLSSDIWNKICSLKIVKKYYLNRDLIGHFVEIKSGSKKAVHFITYNTGRFSLVYEELKKQILEGKKPGDYFVINNVSYQGFWKTLERLEGETYCQKI